MLRSTTGRNLIWLTVSTAGTIGGSFLYGLLAARYLGPADFGRFALVVGVGGLMITLAQSGGSYALILLAAQEPERAGALLWPGLLMQTGIGLVSLTVTTLAVLILSGDAALLWPSVLYGLANLGYFALTVPIAIFTGRNRMQWRLALMAATLLIPLLMLVVIKLKLGLAGVIGANTVAQTLVVVALCPAVYRSFGRQAITWRRPLASRLLKASAALWLVTLFQALHWRTDLVMLQTLGTSSQVGLYSAANKLIETLRVIPSLLIIAVLPEFARAGRDDTPHFRRLIAQAQRYALLVAFPLCATLLLFSNTAIRLVYRTAYAASEPLLHISVLALLPLFAQWVFVNALISLGRGRTLIIIYAVTIVGEMALDTALVPAFAGRGAAVGYVTGEMVAFALSAWFARRAVGSLEFQHWGRVLPPGLLLIALAWFAPAAVNRFLWLGVLGLVYSAGTLLLRAVTVADLRLLPHRQP